MMSQVGSSRNNIWEMETLSGNALEVNSFGRESGGSKIRQRCSVVSLEASASRLLLSSSEVGMMFQSCLYLERRGQAFIPHIWQHRMRVNWEGSMTLGQEAAFSKASPWRAIPDSREISAGRASIPNNNKNSNDNARICGYMLIFFVFRLLWCYLSSQTSQNPYEATLCHHILIWYMNIFNFI